MCCAARHRAGAGTDTGRSAAARSTFERGLVTSLAPPPTTWIELSWPALPGAASYRVVRFPVNVPNAAPAVLQANVHGTSYNARVLPGASFTFHVIALNASGQPIDSAVATSAMTGPPGGSLTVTCQLETDSIRHLTWLAPLNSSGYHVVAYRMSGQGKSPGSHAEAPKQTTLIDSVYTDRSYSFAYDGSTVTPVDVTITAVYTLADYPAPGKTTSVNGASYKRVFGHGCN